MEEVEVTVIGAGIVGLAIAAEVAQSGKEVFVLEKHSTFGREISSRNSEVVHAGIYYPANSLKAKLCVYGNVLLYEICEKNNIPCKKNGKLIVALSEKEEKELENLFSKGIENGVQGLKLMTGKEIKSLEPHIEGVAGLHSPETGVVDSHCLMKYFCSLAKSKDAEFVYKTEVMGIESPGLTASPAIAKYVGELVKKIDLEC